MNKNPLWHSHLIREESFPNSFDGSTLKSFFLALTAFLLVLLTGAVAPSLAESQPYTSPEMVNHPALKGGA